MYLGVHFYSVTTVHFHSAMDLQNNPLRLIR